MDRKDAHITELRAILQDVRGYLAALTSMAAFMLGHDCLALQEQLAKLDAALKLTER